MSRKSRWFLSLAPVVLVADAVTKRVADERLQPPHVPHEVLGEFVRFTLTYNPGAAFSMSLGDHSRWGFTALTFVMLGVLGYIYRTVERTDAWQGAALGLVTGGALGNLVDRLRWDRGVVDFIDVGVGDVRFWTFNVADAGVTVGAILLALVMLRHSPQPSDATR